MASRADVVVLVTVALLAAACSSSRSSSSPSTTVRGAPRVEVDLTNHGCAPVQLTAAPGLTEFVLANRSNAPSSFQVISGDHVVGQIERLGSRQTATLLLDLAPGSYRTTCQIGATASPGGLAVGRGGGGVALSQPADLLSAMDSYRSAVATQADSLVSSLSRLEQSVASGDRIAAQADYASARTSFGQLAPAADNFGDAEPAGQSNLAIALDGPIDAAPGDPPRGLRLIESGLWGTAPLPTVEPTVKAMLSEATALRARVGAMHLDAVEVAGGAADQLGQAVAAVDEDVSTRPSALEVIDLRAAAAGATAVLEALRGALQRRDPGLESTLQARLAQVDAAVATAGSLAPTPSGGLPAGSLAPVLAASDALADAMAQAAPVLDRPVDQ
jgi:iron uptake system component EfeO